jgi:hypothetical protein
MLGLTVPHVGVDEVIASAVCCGALWSRLALFGHVAMSDLSPECEPKRTFTDHSEFMGSRLGQLLNQFASGPRPGGVSRLIGTTVPFPIRPSNFPGDDGP